MITVETKLDAVVPHGVALSLARSGVETVGDLIKRTRTDILRFPGIGHSKLARLELAIKPFELKIGEPRYAFFFITDARPFDHELMLYTGGDQLRLAASAETWRKIGTLALQHARDQTLCPCIMTQGVPCVDLPGGGPCMVCMAKELEARVTG